MKYLLSMFLILFAGCSSPRKILVKNCEAAGNGLYYCEEIEKREIGLK